jgi:hypothetical protein
MEFAVSSGGGGVGDGVRPRRQRRRSGRDGNDGVRLLISGLVRPGMWATSQETAHERETMDRHPEEFGLLLR